uniref:Uncharacterized protein n=1 Tax=candidate division WOR-3 bacterium TaxID=2052148 RepID=A0A7C2P310_UNCW3
MHGYKHRYHLGEGGTERVEATHLILEVFRRAEVPWDREIKPLTGWEGKQDFFSRGEAFGEKGPPAEGRQCLKDARDPSISPEDPRRGKGRLV